MTERFDLDPTGNWTDYVHKSYGTPYLDQDRTHNRANEITQIDSSSTHVAQDAAGNMTKVPTPTSLATGLTCKYDAWNRLVDVRRLIPVKYSSSKLERGWLGSSAASPQFAVALQKGSKMFMRLWEQQENTEQGPAIEKDQS